MSESPDPPADPTPTATPPPAPASVPEAPAPAEDWETQFKYLLADFENFRRRTARQQDQARERARGDLLRRLLPILEAFERAQDATAHLPPKDPIRHGLELLGREWTAFLEAEGVQTVGQPGVPFNPETHEAVAETAASPLHPVGIVVEVVQQGYRFAGGLLRPAKVVVARKAPPPSETAATAEPPSADPTS